MRWKLVFTKQAQKDAKKLAAANLKKKAEVLLVFYPKILTNVLQPMKS